MKRDSTLLLLGLGAAAVYLLYSKAAQAAAAAGQAYTGSVNSFSDWLSSTFGPSVNLPTFYTVIFEDGSSHAVNASTVDANGNFTWTGYPAGSQPAQQLQISVINGVKYAISGG